MSHFHLCHVTSNVGEKLTNTGPAGFVKLDLGQYRQEEGDTERSLGKGYLIWMSDKQQLLGDGNKLPIARSTLAKSDAKKSGSNTVPTMLSQA
jgi:hypothetical protein